MSKFVFGEALGEVLRASHFVEARNIRGGTITAQELVIAGGTQGVIRSQNYNPTTGVGWAIFGDGSATFGGDVTIEGDLLGNWDGTVPVDLSGGQDTGATTGYAIDASEGNVQFLGSVFASGIAFLDAANSNTQVGAIGGSNDELLINNVGSKDMRLQTLTGGDIKFQPGSGGTVTLNDGSDDLFAFYLFSGVPRLEWRPTDLSNVGYISMYESNIGGGSIGNVDIVVPYSSGGSPTLNLVGHSSGDLANFIDFDKIINDGIYYGASGSAGAPTYSFTDDDNTGIYNPAANDLGFITQGATAMLINDTTDMRIDQINKTTTGAAANVFINSTSGLMARSTSSLRYKEGWQYAEEEWLATLEMPTPIVWVDSLHIDPLYDDEDTTPRQDIHLGFATEHVYEMLPAATQDFDRDGHPDNYDVRSLVAILVAKVKRLEAQVAALS